MNDSALADKARNVARCLSYNESAHEAAAKHLLHEMAHRLDTHSVRVRRRGDGRLRVVNGLGKERALTLREFAAYHLFGAIPAAA